MPQRFVQHKCRRGQVFEQPDHSCATVDHVLPRDSFDAAAACMLKHNRQPVAPYEQPAIVHHGERSRLHI
jgi:hypothetical protein